MLTGKKAFEGKSQASLIAAILEHQPAPPSAVQPLTPPAVDHVVATLPGERSRRAVAERTRSGPRADMDR